MEDDRYYTINLEDLLAGAFIATDLSRNRFISWEKLGEYEHLVGEYMKKGSHRWRFDLGRNQTSWVLYYGRDFYEEISIEGRPGILLKQGVTKDQIRNKYMGYIGLPVLKALTSDQCTKVFEQLQ